MAMLADLVELVIGVDTHKDTHTAAVVAAATGAVVEQVTVPATPAGYRQLLRLADQHHGRRVWAIEGTGGYGAGLTRFLQRPCRAGGGAGPAQAGRPPPRRQVRPPGRDPGGPRGAGPRPARPASSGRPAGGVVGAAGRPPLGGPGHHRRPTPAACPGGRRPRHPPRTAAGLDHARLVSTCARLRQQADWDAETAATAASLRALARRIQLLNAEIADHTRAITTLVRAWRPDLLTRLRGGPDRGRHRAVRLVPSRPLPKRRRLRHARRGRADPRLLRPDRPGPAESLRGPPAQPGPSTWSS